MIGRISWVCWFTGWVLGWAVAVYFSSAMIAALDLSPVVPAPAPGVWPLAQASFKVADWVSPQAKLVLGALLALGFLGVAASGVRRLVLRALAGIGVALAAMAATLALLPAGWSRGFGVGLGGARFDAASLPAYAGAAALAGLVFALVELRCRARRR